MNSFGQAPAKLGSVMVEQTIGADVIKSLEDRGAKLQANKKGPWASPVMIRVDPVTGLIEAAGEGRSTRYAGAY